MSTKCIKVIIGEYSLRTTKWIIFVKIHFLVKMDSGNPTRWLPLIPLTDKRLSKRIKRMSIKCIVDYSLVYYYKVDHFGKKSTFLFN